MSIAVRFGSAARSNNAAFDPNAYRASAAIRFGGICDSFNRPSWNALISSTRSSARANAVPVVRVGGRRSRSSSENSRALRRRQRLHQIAGQRRIHAAGGSRDGGVQALVRDRPRDVGGDLDHDRVETGLLDQ
ncbi:hypothetical protein JBF12_00015 [Streptomyces javensis]|uniref:Uncharacterized protein n=1 Tax=Streptomyces javensis TaxID=114698 RepID=A0ABS0R233_9ACTN|nr:hypothetical protein [Streptomyces javensis]MBI0311449.1 hypothetical protein [Streptomyces javensis]